MMRALKILIIWCIAAAIGGAVWSWCRAQNHHREPEIDHDLITRLGFEGAEAEVFLRQLNEFDELRRIAAERVIDDPDLDW